MLIEGYTDNVKRFLALGSDLIYVFPREHAADEYFRQAVHYFRDFVDRKSRHDLRFQQGSLLRGIIVIDDWIPITEHLRGFRGPALLYPKPHEFQPRTREEIFPEIWAHNEKWFHLIRSSGVQTLNEEEQKQWRL